MYYKIETKMRDREIEAQKNQTLLQEIKIQDLERKQEEDRKKSEEILKQYQQNVEKLNRQNENIQSLLLNFTKSIA